jgi:hypothetical protein
LNQDHDVFANLAMMSSFFRNWAPYVGPLSHISRFCYPNYGTRQPPHGRHETVKGTEIETDIFVGVVYYQRLRHLVMDKAQVRARGSLDEWRQRGNNSVVKGSKSRGDPQILNDFEETRCQGVKHSRFF